MLIRNEFRNSSFDSNISFVRMERIIQNGAQDAWEDWLLDMKKTDFACRWLQKRNERIYILHYKIGHVRKSGSGRILLELRAGSSNMNHDFSHRHCHASSSVSAEKLPRA